MSIFKNILFLQDYPSNVRTSDDPARSYAQGYGNHVASAQAFAPLGHAHAQRNPIAAPRRAARLAGESRALETCG
jgi:hypothetical protein